MQIPVSKATRRAIARSVRRSEIEEAQILVPREPTRAMMDAGLYQCSADMKWEDLYSAWKDMLAAVARDNS